MFLANLLRVYLGTGVLGYSLGAGDSSKEQFCSFKVLMQIWRINRSLRSCLATKNSNLVSFRDSGRLSHFPSCHISIISVVMSWLS